MGTEVGGLSRSPLETARCLKTLEEQWSERQWSSAWDKTLNPKP